ncbi:hypothetical protein [Flavobacterium sp.]|uniref:hypothetical protein n=1 Tax=Flavobacterium sp. TaxID=239 RepID=UPI004048B74A
MKIRIIIVSFALILTSCLGQTNKGYRGELSQPSDAIININNSVFNNLNETDIEIIKRYIAGNSRWEIRKEGDKTYAIRKEKKDGVYTTTLNGYYSNFESASKIYQTRVIISFGKYYGHGNDESHITFSSTKDSEIKLKIEGEHSGTPGNSSYLIIKGEDINVEIYEQAKEINRAFTIQTIEELNTEFSEVLKHREEINKNGVMPMIDYYPNTYESEFFNINDGMQPGIYVVQAGLIIEKEGVVFVKAFETKNNSQLSEDRMTSRTEREIGWSENGQNVFPYETELTVYEGDWDNEYSARFEIWFRDQHGNESKIAEKTRQIYGWQR